MILLETHSMYNTVVLLRTLIALILNLQVNLVVHVLQALILLSLLEDVLPLDYTTFLLLLAVKSPSPHQLLPLPRMIFPHLTGVLVLMCEMMVDSEFISILEEISLAILPP